VRNRRHAPAASHLSRMFVKKVVQGRRDRKKPGAFPNVRQPCPLASSEWWEDRPKTRHASLPFHRPSHDRLRRTRRRAAPQSMRSPLLRIRALSLNPRGAQTQIGRLRNARGQRRQGAGRPARVVSDFGMPGGTFGTARTQDGSSDLSFHTPRLNLDIPRGQGCCLRSSIADW
jgi:hypothetical protein